MIERRVRRAASAEIENGHIRKSSPGKRKYTTSTGTWKRCTLDVRVKKGANVGGNYHRVTAFIKFKLRRTGRRMTRHRRFDNEKLRAPKVKSAFVLQVKNRFQALQNLEEEAVHPETEINRVASVCKESSEEAWSSGREGRGKNG